MSTWKSMNHGLDRSWTLLGSLVLTLGMKAQTILIYANDFESPNQTPAYICSPDIDGHQVNTLWGGTGTGTCGTVSWDQTFTVETILVNGPDNIYTDPLGQAGNYCLGMLATLNYDLIALPLDAGNLSEVNLTLDLSAVDVYGCGGPWGTATPTLVVTAYDTPGGNFTWTSIGAELDVQTLIGAPASTPPYIYTFAWATLSTALDVSSSTDGHFTIVFNLENSPYGAIDNIVVTAIDPHLDGVIESAGGRERVIVSPVPADDQLCVANASPTTRWAVLDLSGVQVQAGTSLNNGRLDISALSSGLYVLDLVSSSGRSRTRFVKR